MGFRSVNPHVVGRIAKIAFAALAAMALAGGGLVGCTPPQSQSDGNSTQAAVTVVDRQGRSVEIPENIERVVGVGCSLRPICYLQAVDKVVGVEKAEHDDMVSCAYRHVNHETFAKLPIIGEGGSKGVSPDAEAIVTVAPQVVIAGGLKADEADALQEKTGIPVVCIDQPEAIFGPGYYDNIAFLGKVLGKESRADEIVSYLKAAEQDLADRSARSESYGRISAYAGGISYRGGHGFDGTEAGFPPFAVCGVTNIADGSGASGPFTIDLEAVSAARPDHVFLESGNLALVADDYKANPDYFNALDAVRDGRVATLISYRFYSTNVELALANCYQVGATVYPDAFSDVEPSEKLDEISRFFLSAPLSADLAEKGYEFRQIDLSKL